MTTNPVNSKKAKKETIKSNPITVDKMKKIVELLVEEKNISALLNLIDIESLNLNQALEDLPALRFYNHLKNNDLNAMEKMLATGFNPHKQKTEGVSQGFYYVALSRGLKVLALLMDKYYPVDDVNFKVKRSRAQNVSEEVLASPLHLCIRFGHFKLFEKLIKRGTDINKPDSDGWPPLFWAVLYNEPSLGLELIKRGAQCASIVSEKEVIQGTATGKLFSRKMDWREIYDMKEIPEGVGSEKLFGDRKNWNGGAEFLRQIFELQIPKSVNSSPSIKIRI